VKIRPEHRTRHWVVLLADGTVLDGLGSQPRQLSDYFHVYGIVGIIPDISAPLGKTRAETLQDEQGTRYSASIEALTLKYARVRLLGPEHLLKRRRDASRFATEQFRRWLNVDPLRLKP
jgi:hypothetical protein